MITFLVSGKRRSNVVILKWVFSWEWGVVKMASELILTLEDLPSGDVSQGNTEHLGSHLPRKLHSPTRLELTGRVSPLPFMP